MLGIVSEENQFLQKHIVVFQEAIVQTFDQSDWTKLGYETGESHYINNHPRLLRSLSWQDSDYGQCVFGALEHIFGKHPSRIKFLTENNNIKNWIKKEKPETYSEIYNKPHHVPIFSPQKISPKDVVNKALEDANSSIAEGEPEKAVDRMHTAFHGYLKSICEENSIAFASDADVTKLFTLIYDNIIKLGNNISHPEEIKKILRGSAGTVNAINTLRNHASMAHVNDLLGKDEAYLMVHSIRSLLHYLEAKIR